MYQNFSSNDLTSSATGENQQTGATLSDQIKKLSEEITALRKEQGDKDTYLKTYLPWLSGDTYRNSCGNNKSYWYDSGCYDNNHIANEKRKLLVAYNAAKARFDALPKIIEDKAKQIEDLTKTLSTLAKNDPRIQVELTKAQAEAAKVQSEIDTAKSKSRNRRTIIFAVAGLILLVGVGYVVAKYRKK